MTVTDLVASFAGLLPSGFFLLDGLESWLAEWLSQPGRTNDFRPSGKKLRVVAVALDTGETRVFGEPGNDTVPISRAVAASCALPGFFRPVRIDGVDYIDGGVQEDGPHLPRAEGALRPRPLRQPDRPGPLRPGEGTPPGRAATRAPSRAAASSRSSTRSSASRSTRGSSTASPATGASTPTPTSSSSSRSPRSSPA